MAQQAPTEQNKHIREMLRGNKSENKPIILRPNANIVFSKNMVFVGVCFAGVRRATILRSGRAAPDPVLGSLRGAPSLPRVDPSCPFWSEPRISQPTGGGFFLGEMPARFGAGWLTWGVGLGGRGWGFSVG